VRAIDSMSGDPERFLGSLRWALRHLGNLAYARADYAGAADRFEALVALDGSDPREWDMLASTRARLRDWTAAEQAWRKSEQANPADGDRPRYLWRLAAQAAALGELPTALPDGRAIESLTKEDLEAVLSEQADVVRAVQAELPVEASPTEDDRERLQSTLDEAHGLFVAAGLEYGVRNHPIRETAFFGGYAPLIFHAHRWTIAE
jgi:tetratricopeptide (TPR) repeat protein